MGLWGFGIFYTVHMMSVLSNSRILEPLEFGIKESGMFNLYIEVRSGKDADVPWSVPG